MTIHPNDELKSFVTKVSHSVLVTQSRNVIRDELDIIEELITNSYDNWVRKGCQRTNNLVVIEYNRSNKKKAVLEILDFCGGMFRKDISRYLGHYGDGSTTHSSKQRGQFNRGLKEAILASLKDNDNATVVSHVDGEKAWAYDVTVENNELTWRLIGEEKHVQRIKSIIPDKKKKYYQIPKNYFYIRIPIRPEISNFKVETLMKKIQKDIKTCRVLDYLDCYFKTKKGWFSLKNKEKEIIKPKKGGYNRTIEAILDLSTFKEKFDLKQQDKMSLKKFKELLRPKIKFRIIECDFEDFMTIDGFKPRRSMTAKHPDITVEGVTVSDGTLAHDKINFFDRTDELRVLYMELEIPNFKDFALAGTGLDSIVGPPMIPADRTILQKDHPLFLAFLNNQRIKKVYKEAIEHIQQERRRRLKATETAIVNDVTERVRREINQFLSKEIEPKTKSKEIDSKNKEDLEQKGRSKETQRTKTKKSPSLLPILGILVLERAGGEIKRYPGSVRTEKIVCHRNLLDYGGAIHFEEEKYSSIEIEILSYNPDKEEMSFFPPDLLNIAESQKEMKSHYVFRRWTVIPGNMPIDSLVGIILKIQRKYLTQLGRDLVNVIDAYNNGKKSGMELIDWISKNFGIQIEEPHQYFSNWEIKLDADYDEPMIIVRYFYLIKERKSKIIEDEENPEIFGRILYERGFEYTDPVTKASKQISKESDPYDLVTFTDRFDLIVLLRSNYFVDCYNPNLELHKQGKEFYRSLGTIVALSVGHAMIGSQKHEREPIDHILKSLREISTSIRKQYLLTKLETVTK